LTFDQTISRSKNPSTAARFYMSFTAGLATAIGVLLYASYLVTASWDFLYSTYGIQLTLSDLTPNIGLWWYFFIEMFDSFRHFFLAVFWLHMSSYVVGLSIRIRCVALKYLMTLADSSFRTQPLFVITALLGIFTIFKPYPSIADASLFFAMVPLFRHILPRK
jgi:phosphatidylinositol glycan class U